MTEIIFFTVFLLCVGYVIGKLFKGLHPFKLLFGFSFGFAICIGLLEANNNWYTGLFILGFLLNFSNPFRGVLNSIEDYKLHRMYQKSLNNQKADIEADLEDQVNKASSHYSKKEEELRRERARLERERAEFERNKNRNTQSEASKSIQESIDDAMKLLGLKSGFTKKDLKRAYKRESMKYHPDRGAGQPEHIKNLMSVKFKEVVSAYNYLEKEAC